MSAYDDALNIIESNFYNFPLTHRQRITKKQLRSILLADLRPMAKGDLWDIHYKHLGLGVYEIWFKRKMFI